MRFKILFFVAMILGMVACNNTESPMDVIVGGDVETTVQVAIPEASRAEGVEGFNLSTLGTKFELRFILEIYNTEDDATLPDNESRSIEEQSCSRMVQYSSVPSTAFDVRLAPERNYRFVVWADIVAKQDERVAEGDYDHYYETSSSLKNVSIIDENWTCNALDRDAYTGFKDVDNFTSASSINIQLVRPFAMLRVVTVNDDTVVTKLGVDYTSVPTIFNAYTGEIGVATTKSHDNVTPYNIVDGERTLFTDFIFASDQDSSFNFTMSAYNDDSETPFKEIPFEVAIKRNCLTTVKGKLLNN